MRCCIVLAALAFAAIAGAQGEGVIIDAPPAPQNEVPETGGHGTADFVTENIVYRDGDVELTGYVSYEHGATEKRPIILVVHEWWGLGEHAKNSAKKLAHLGYVGFALDMYGTGKLTQDPKQAGAWAGEFKSDPEKAVKRFRAGLDAARKLEMADGSRVAAIGYCFGGTMVLEAARSGVELAGVASFHGALASALPAGARSYEPRILALHGADDPFVSPEELAGFKKEMQDGKADWVLVEYGNAVHSFTNPEAKGDLKGAQYNEKAATRSWKALEEFLEELFTPAP